MTVNPANIISPDTQPRKMSRDERSKTTKVETPQGRNNESLTANMAAPIATISSHADPWPAYLMAAASERAPREGGARGEKGSRALQPHTRARPPLTLSPPSRSLGYPSTRHSHRTRKTQTKNKASGAAVYSWSALNNPRAAAIKAGLAATYLWSG